MLIRAVGQVTLKEVKELTRDLLEGMLIGFPIDSVPLDHRIDRSQGLKPTDFIQWLCPEPFDRKHTTIKSQRQQGTGEWFVSGMCDWLSSKEFVQFVWCRAIRASTLQFHHQLYSLTVHHDSWRWEDCPHVSRRSLSGDPKLTSVQVYDD